MMIERLMVEYYWWAVFYFLSVKGKNSVGCKNKSDEVLSFEGGVCECECAWNIYIHIFIYILVVGIII